MIMTSDEMDHSFPKIPCVKRTSKSMFPQPISMEPDDDLCTLWIPLVQ